MKNKFINTLIKRSSIYFLCLLVCFKGYATDVSGDQGDSIWTKAKSPYNIIGNVMVGPNQTLTIEPGVKVGFTTGTIQLQIQGTLKAIGTITDSIYFFKTGNFSGNQSTPIHFEASSQNSEMQFVKADGLGHYYNDNFTYAILISSSGCTISKCTIQNIRGSALGIDESAKPMVSENIITSNANLDVILNPNELRNITGNNSLNIGLINNTTSISDKDTLKAENNFYRLLTNLTIPITIKFTINPGVEVQFETGNIQLSIQGTLTAIGSKGNNIKFFKHDGFSGNQNTPISFETVSQNSIMKNVTIDGLGFYYNTDITSAVFIQSSSCIVDSCIIQNTRGTAIVIGKSAKPVISNSTFYNNSNLDVVLDPDRITNLVNNNLLKIGLTNNIAMAKDDTLPINVFYRLLNTLTIPKTKKLKINAGVELQIPTGGTQLIVQGQLITEGMDGSYVHFTRFNGFSGNQVIPIIVDTSSQNSVLQYLSVEELGYYYNTGTTPVILIKTSSCQFVNSIIQSSRGVAVEITNSASPSFYQSCFYNNENGAVLSTSGKAFFTSCNFSGNTIGIENKNIIDTINAENCYWGDALGPFQSANNPTAVGDAVSNNVAYQPFSPDPFICTEKYILPLTLLTFQASLNNNSITCAWQTASEINTSHFFIQRSSNGRDFNNIGQIKAAGNSTNAKSYQFTDKEPLNGTSYYRLQMIDIDGRFTFSKVVAINNARIKDAFVIYPNPVANNLFVQIESIRTEKVVFQVTDVQGKTIQLQTNRLQPGTNSFSINTSALARGTYILLIKGENILQKTFIKQ